MQINLPNIYYYIDQFNLSDLSKLNNKINIIYRNYKKKFEMKLFIRLKVFVKPQKKTFYCE